MSAVTAGVKSPPGAGLRLDARGLGLRRVLGLPAPLAFFLLRRWGGGRRRRFEGLVGQREAPALGDAGGLQGLGVEHLFDVIAELPLVDAEMVGQRAGRGGSELLQRGGDLFLNGAHLGFSLFCGGF
jgi:hypothetical protein